MADLGNMAVPASFCANVAKARKEGILIKKMLLWDWPLASQ